MQSHAHRGVLFQHLHKWQVRALIAFLVNVFKVADRLVGVNQKREMKFWRHGDVARLRNNDTAMRNKPEIATFRSLSNDTRS